MKMVTCGQPENSTPWASAVTGKGIEMCDIWSSNPRFERTARIWNAQINY